MSYFYAVKMRLFSLQGVQKKTARCELLKNIMLTLLVPACF